MNRTSALRRRIIWLVRCCNGNTSSRPCQFSFDVMSYELQGYLTNSDRGDPAPITCVLLLVGYESIVLLVECGMSQVENILSETTAENTVHRGPIRSGPDMMKYTPTGLTYAMQLSNRPPNLWCCRVCPSARLRFIH
jgi:hypothetical protein